MDLDKVNRNLKDLLSYPLLEIISSSPPPDYCHLLPPVPRALKPFCPLKIPVSCPIPTGTLPSPGQ